MNQVVLLLGSNLKNRIEILSKTRLMIEAELGKIISVSSIYESEPWGFKSQNSFLNQAIILETNYSPAKTLEMCLSIENKLGRVREEGVRYSDRSIDIDILLYADLIISIPGLEIPHPRMHERRFCMEPLSEIAPNWLIPTFNKTTLEVLENCLDNSRIIKLNVEV